MTPALTQPGLLRSHPGASQPANATPGTSLPASTGTGGAGAESVTNYLTYVGGKAGPANKSLPPVYIGYINQQGGPTSIGLLATAGAQMAVNYANAELGGVDGHPIQLVTCFPTDPGMPAYEAVAKKYSTPANEPDPWNIVNFGQLLTTIKILNEVGYANITPQAVLAKAKAFTGPQALGAPALACGKYASAPGVCNDRAQFFEYKGNHVFVKVAGWLQPPS